MLGYVRAYKPELKFKDYDVYKGVYCTLCKQLLKSYSPLAQLFLSYDVCFLALFMLSFTTECPGMKKSRCCYNPLKRCHSCGADSQVMRYCAAVSVIMGYYKLRDNLADKGFLKKLASCILYPAAALMHIKARRLEPETDKIVSQAMEQQAAAEKNPHCVCDEAAEPSARALSKIAGEAYGFISQEVSKSQFERLGYLLGRFVYIVDAVDDIKDDKKSGNFNVLLSRYVELTKGENPKEFYLYAERLLNRCIGECVKTFEEMKPLRYYDIIYNVLFDGLYNSALFVLKKHNEEVQA